MKGKRMLSAFLALVTVLSVVLSSACIVFADGQSLIPTDQVRKFDLGSDAVGGSGVEGTSNWIKIIQSANKLKLFEDVPKDVNVAAVQVTFVISNWSGVEFPITWGCNLNFIGDKGSTWCGTDAFSGFSNYIINREGEYTVTCDLAQLCKNKGKEGIAWLQTCEMVIGNLTEGDSTVIEIVSASIYLPGETVPADNAPINTTVEVDTIVIDPANVGKINNGIFQGWGTSLCWYGNRIGGSEKASQEAAQLLYNAETGLGLNIIRYNIGGGDDPTHTHIQRSDSNMPGYWTNYDPQTGEFQYDYTLDANQYNVLLKSIAECPDMLVEMFSNSAPYFMTRSGCTSGTTDDVKSNITVEQMPIFAEYLATVVKHYVDAGINVVSIEPMNEPSNGWNVAYYGVKQEGCSIEKGEEQSAMILAMYEAMEKYGLTDIALAGMDETNDTTTNQAIKKLSEDALGLLDQFNTHTYSRNATSSQKLNQTALELGKNLWMSESDNGGVKGTDAGEMGAALNFAAQITDDLNDLQPSAWIMWQAIGSYCDANNEFDPDTLDQKTLDTEGFWGVCYADMNTETIVTTKKYYAFGQYTRYIRPGDYLIATDDSYTTAAYSAEDGQIKIVIYNTDAADREVSFDLSAFTVPGVTAEVIRTSGDYASGENWAVLETLAVNGGKLRATVKANSVTTFVVSGASHDMAAEVAKTDAPADAPTQEKTNIELTNDRPYPAAQSAVGQICFASGDWSYTVMTEDALVKTGITVSTMESGSYTIVLPAPAAEDGSSTEVLSTVVFSIDLIDYAQMITGIDVTALSSDEDKAAYHTRIAQTVKGSIDSITLDGEALEFDASKIVVDDTEENGNLRLEVYNMYGPTAEDAAIEPDVIGFSESMAIQFTITLADISETAEPATMPAETEHAPAEPSAPEHTEPQPQWAPADAAAWIIMGIVIVAAAIVAVVIVKRNKS